MEYTCMTIHDLGPDAKILFASDSITDILGYRPGEVQGRSCFDYFHPDEVPFARSVHSRGILLDKAAVLHYARIRSRDGDWVSCECCFTIVHDVLVACISIYQGNEKSQKRALDAPQIRRLFACSPRDPRYHMLQHLSPKFDMPPAHREPRAALILNRFTRSLSVMFCTNAIASILGLPAEDVQDKSFYECIQESCLEEAVKCLESAKANDSIAYMRFWSRDPRREEDIEDESSESESENEEVERNGTLQTGVDGQEAQDHIKEEESEGEDASGGIGSHQQHRHDSQLSDSDSGGVRLDEEMDIDSDSQSGPRVKVEEQANGVMDVPQNPRAQVDGATAAEPSSFARNRSDGNPVVDGEGQSPVHSASMRNRGRRTRYPLPSVELEAVVSCTSDGLVVILRKARPPIPNMQSSAMPVTPPQGIFAAPWGHHPVQPQYHVPTQASVHQPPASQAPPLARAAGAPSNGPPLDHLMGSIREIAVFAWALCGINGNLASYSRGIPMAGAQPFGGLPIWDPHAGQTSYQGPENQAVSRWAAYENGTLHWPSRGLGTGRVSFHSHLRASEPKEGDNYTPNAHNNASSDGRNGPNSSGHGSRMFNGRSNLDSNGYETFHGHGPHSMKPNSHSNGMPRGYNDNSDGRSSYIFDPTRQNHAPPNNGNMNTFTNEYSWNDSSTEDAWDSHNPAHSNRSTDRSNSDTDGHRSYH